MSRLNINKLSKLIPNLIPPAEEPENRDSISFINILESFDPEKLTEDQFYPIYLSERELTAFSFDTESMLEAEHTAQWRLMRARSLYGAARRKLANAEERWKKGAGNYKQCRSFLGTCVRLKAVVYLISLEIEEQQSSAEEEMGFVDTVRLLSDEEKSALDEISRYMMGHPEAAEATLALVRRDDQSLWSSIAGMMG